MIDLGRAALHAEGIVAFADHADPLRFHYLPDGPRLRFTTDGAPEILLTKYRLDPALLDALGAGMLSFTVDLGVAPETLDRLAARLQHQLELGARPTLAPVTAEAGSCELVLLDHASTDDGAKAGEPSALVARILGGASPSLYGDNEVTFMAALTMEGASLVEAALRGGGLPAGVVYRLEVLGLRPALRAQITARWDDVYRYYEDRLHGGKLLLAVDIGETVEALVHAEAITIQVDELVPAAERDPTYDRALALAQRYVVEQLFKPTLGQAPPADESGGALAVIGGAVKGILGAITFTYSLKHVDRSELKTFSYRLDVAAAEKITLAPQGTFSLLLAPPGASIDPEKLIRVVEPAAAAEMQLDVAAEVDLAAEEIDRIEVTFRYGEAVALVTLTPSAPRQKVSFWFDAAIGLGVRSSYEVAFRAGASGPVDRLRSAETTSESRVVRLDPRELFRRVEIRAVAGGIPFDRFPSVIVDLQADDPASGWSSTQTLVLDAAHPEGAWRLRAALDSPLRVQRRLRYVNPHGVETIIEWDSVEPGILVVGDPFPDVLDVQIAGSARFDTEVLRLIVELRPTAAPEQVATRVLTREQPFATWSILVGDRDRDERAYEYRVTVHTVRNEVREGPWLPGAGATLVVGEGIARLRQVQVLFVGRTFKDLALLGVKIRFAFDDADASLHAEDELLITDASQPARWSYPVADPSRQTYTCQMTLIHADGRMEARDPIAATDLLLVYPLT